MYSLTKKEFKKLTKKGNLIPIFKEVVADLETPVSSFLKISQNSDYAILLESVEGEEKIARYSFLASHPSLIFKSKGKNIEINQLSRKVLKFNTNLDPIDEVKKIMRQFKFVNVKGIPRFCGGMVGYIGYDTVRFFEQLPDKNPDDLKLPDILLMLVNTLLIFDHSTHKIKIISCAYLENKSQVAIDSAYNKAIKKIEDVIGKLKSPLKPKSAHDKKTSGEIKISSNLTKKGFEQIVRQGKDYIKAGDIIQVVLSQRFNARLTIGDFEVYRSLRSINPSAYMYFLKLKDFSIIGSSPELLVRCENGIVETRPIAGTRHRGKDEAQDNQLARDLSNDQKEKAEHIMLLDLGRNDLGRVCKEGSISVTEFMKVEKYSHVMHLVSNVRGVLKKGKDIYDVLRAAFPAGTVTGAPKVRAMEIIEELENLNRGPYAGCVGYFSFSANLDTCITIRTIVIKNKKAYFQAGAGIVADSVPEKEYFETINKAKALVSAIKLARELDPPPLFVSRVGFIG